MRACGTASWRDQPRVRGGRQRVGRAARLTTEQPRGRGASPLILHDHQRPLATQTQRIDPPPVHITRRVLRGHEPHPQHRLHVRLDRRLQIPLQPHVRDRQFHSTPSRPPEDTHLRHPDGLLTARRSSAHDSGQRPPATADGLMAQAPPLSRLRRPPHRPRPPPHKAPRCGGDRSTRREDATSGAPFGSPVNTGRSRTVESRAEANRARRSPSSRWSSIDTTSGKRRSAGRSASYVPGSTWAEVASRTIRGDGIAEVAGGRASRWPEDVRASSGPADDPVARARRRGSGKPQVGGVLPGGGGWGGPDSNPRPTDDEAESSPRGTWGGRPLPRRRHELSAWMFSSFTSRMGARESPRTARHAPVVRPVKAPEGGGGPHMVPKNDLQAERRRRAEEAKRPAELGRGPLLAGLAPCRDGGI